MRGAPSPWVERFAPLIPTGSPVLDLACGQGRHTQLLLGLGFDVLAVDRDVSGVADLTGDPRLRVAEVDLEAGGELPFLSERFGAVVVTNYLHRPLLPALVTAVDRPGAFIYETFAAGNERFGRPARPEFLLQPGELLDAVADAMEVVAYEDVVVEAPRPAVIQHIAARRGSP